MKTEIHKTQYKLYKIKREQYKQQYTTVIMETLHGNFFVIKNQGQAWVWVAFPAPQLHIHKGARMLIVDLIWPNERKSLQYEAKFPLSLLLSQVSPLKELSSSPFLVTAITFWNSKPFLSQCQQSPRQIELDNIPSADRQKF